MYIMCLIIFEEKAEAQDQYPLCLNPVKKADDPIQDRNRSIGPIRNHMYRLFQVGLFALEIFLPVS